MQSCSGQLAWNLICINHHEVSKKFTGGVWISQRCLYRMFLPISVPIRVWGAQRVSTRPFKGGKNTNLVFKLDRTGGFASVAACSVLLIQYFRFQDWGTCFSPEVQARSICRSFIYNSACYLWFELLGRTFLGWVTVNISSTKQPFLLVLAFDFKESPVSMLNPSPFC